MICADLPIREGDEGRASCTVSLRGASVVMAGQRQRAHDARHHARDGVLVDAKTQLILQKAIEAITMMMTMSMKIEASTEASTAVG